MKSNSGLLATLLEVIVLSFLKRARESPTLFNTMNFLEALKWLFTANMSISFLSIMLNRKTSHNHYYNPVIIQVADDTSALKIASEIPHTHIENAPMRSASIEEQKHDNRRIQTQSTR